MIFNIDSKDKSKYFYNPLILGFLFDLVLVFCFAHYKDVNFEIFLKLLLGILIGQSFLFNIPLLIFFYNHHKKDKSTKLTIENNGESFVYENNGIKISFTNEDIEKVILRLSPPLYENRSAWLYWDDYFYSEVITNKGVFKISCLVIDTIEDYINEDKIERVKTFFPLIKKLKARARL